MLSYNMVKPNILEVKETVHGFTETRTQYWYYDIQNWIKSSHGRKNDSPDRIMNESDIEWVKKYYLPKII